MNHTASNPGGERTPQTFKDRMSYGDYLQLDTILGAQGPLSRAHDEMLFIVQHQTTELWMRLAIYEIRAARAAIGHDELPFACKTLSRVSQIFAQMTSAWEVLRTITPGEFASFRGDLGQSSGLQSFQYREIEFLFGNRSSVMLRSHGDRPDRKARLQEELTQPSLYDEVLRLFVRYNIDLPGEVLQRDISAPHQSHPAVLDAWRRIYREPDRHRSLYELGERLIDLEDHFRRWRFNHVTTVERIIGLKKGTGGTGGASYLRRMLEVVLFPDLWNVRTEL